MRKPMIKFSKTLKAAALAGALAMTASTGASAAGPSAIAGLKNADVASSVIEVGGRGHHHHHRGRNIGLGILGAAAATAIIAGAARADSRRDRYERCEYYDRKCARGYGWACRKFDRYCDYY